MRTGRELWPAIAITAAAALAFLVTHPLDVFWTTDGGNRFVQVQQLARTWTLGIEYRGRSIDPEFQYAPTAGYHFLVRDGRLQSFYSPAFAIVSAPLYRLLGLAGLYVIPLLSTIASLFLFRAVARELGGDRWMAWSATALVFLTPVFFYTVSFWEHTLAIALTLAGILLALRGQAAAGGAVVALGAVFREEGYIALAAIAIALFATRRFRDAVKFSIVAGLVLAPLWIMNYIQEGHPLGVHSAVYEVIDTGGISERVSNFWVYLFAFTSTPVARLAAGIPAILLLLLAPFRATPLVMRIRTVLLYAAAAGAFVSAYALVTSPQPLNESFTTQSLFGAIPLALTFFVVTRELPRFLTVLIGTTILLTCLTLHQANVGLIWGPRHFLWLVPFLVIATVHAIPRLPRSALPALAMLGVATLVIQLHGVRLLGMKLDFSGEMLRTLRTSGAEVVVTDVYWLAEEMSALWFERKFLWVESDEELAAVIDRLKSRGVRRMDFVAARNFHLVSPQGYAPLLAHTRGRRRVGGERSMVTDVQVLFADLGATPSSRSRTESRPKTDPRPASQR